MSFRLTRLGTKKEPKWLDLPRGVRLRIGGDVLLGRMAATRTGMELRKEYFDAEREPDEDRIASETYIALARRVVDAWEGVEFEDGTAAECTPDYVEALLRDPTHPYCPEFQIQWNLHQYLEAEEKKDSAPSPSGTGGANEAQSSVDPAT